MTGLVRMRLVRLVRTGRALPPLLAGLIVIGVLYGGGQARAAEAYGVSAVVLFPVLAWQTRLLLDAESDVQRRLVLVAIGGRRRELVAGLLAAGLAGLGTVGLALVLPWLIGGIRGPLDMGLLIGIWAHLLALAAAVGLGALASRAATGSATYGLAILVGGAVGALVLGVKGSVVPWLAPPVMAVARAAAGAELTAGTALALTGHALSWTAVALAGYAWVRRNRA